MARSRLTATNPSEASQQFSFTRRALVMAAAQGGVGLLLATRMGYLSIFEQEHYKLLAESLPVFVDLGAKIPLWWLHEKTRIPQAGEQEEMLQRLVEPPPAQLKGVAALKGGLPGEEQHPADLVADRLDSEAQPVIDAWLARIETMLAQAESLEQFKEMLLAAYGDLPTGDLAEILASGLTAAEAAGRFDLEEQSRG